MVSRILASVGTSPGPICPFSGFASRQKAGRGVLWWVAVNAPCQPAAQMAKTTAGWPRTNASSGPGRRRPSCQPAQSPRSRHRETGAPQRLHQPPSPSLQSDLAASSSAAPRGRASSLPTDPETKIEDASGVSIRIWRTEHYRDQVDAVAPRRGDEAVVRFGRPTGFHAVGASVRR
jgi:hypothetical protein